MSEKPKNNNLFTTLVFVSIVLTLVMVVLSAHIRLSLNGLGCSPWPDCYGQIGQAAQYGPVNSFTDANPNKPHGLARTFHRVAASALGVLVVVILILALRRRTPPGVGPTLPILLFVLTVFLSVLGYSTPSPWVPAVTLGNLLGGLAMLALLWWLGQRSVPAPAGPMQAVRLKPWAVVALVVLGVQLTLGAWVSANFAAHACPELLSCPNPGGVALWLQAFDPLRTLSIDADGRIVRDATMPVIQLAHRLGALLSAAILALVALKALRAGAPLRATAISIAVLLLLQLLLGLVAVQAQLPLALVTTHNAAAALLLLAVVNLNHQVFRQR